MARCVVSTYLDHTHVLQLEAEALRRGSTMAAIIREIVAAALPFKDASTPAAGTSSTSPSATSSED